MTVLTPVRPCIPESFMMESAAVIRRVKGWSAMRVSASMFIGERRDAAAKQQHTYYRNQSLGVHFSISFVKPRRVLVAGRLAKVC